MLKRYVIIAIVVLWGLQGCTFSPNPPATPNSETANASSSIDSLSAVEQSIYQQINQYRQSLKVQPEEAPAAALSKLNLPPLKLDARITEQARQHSDAMANGTPLGHEGFEQRVKAIGIPYSRVAENVAFNQGYSDPATQAVQGWIDSSGHRHNIKGQFSWTGVGVSQSEGKYYFTQIFLER